MKTVHQYQDVILLSDKEVESVNGCYVKFKDESIADLDQKSIINRGKGEIKFEYSIDEDIQDAITKNYNFNECNEVILNGGNVNFEILPSDKSSLEIIGTDTFHSTTKIYETNTGMRIDVINNSDVVMGDIYVNGKRIKGDPIEGKLIIKVQNPVSLHVQSNGKGKGIIKVSIDDLDVKINGSMDIECETVVNAHININGSGNVHIKNISEYCEAKINGSGSIVIDSGEIDQFKSTINGSGVIKGDIKVNNAELVLHGSGDIFVAHVVEESFEVHGGSGTVQVGLRSK